MQPARSMQWEPRLHVYVTHPKATPSAALCSQSTGKWSVSFDLEAQMKAAPPIMPALQYSPTPSSHATCRAMQD